MPNPKTSATLNYSKLIFTVQVTEFNADRLSSGSSCTECSNSSQLYKSSVPGCSAEFNIYAWRVLLYGRADTKDWLDSRRLREIAVRKRMTRFSVTCNQEMLGVLLSKLQFYCHYQKS